jgi:hypothetical protein
MTDNERDRRWEYLLDAMQSKDWDYIDEHFPDMREDWKRDYPEIGRRTPFGHSY